ncbi:MAG: hypothetical protein D6737_13340, partial [Chloroflexi bacterium]
AFVSRTQGRQLGGFGLDAMLSIPVTPDMLATNPELRFNMTSFNKSTTGDYVVIFHIGTAPAAVG